MARADRLAQSVAPKTVSLHMRQVEWSYDGAEQDPPTCPANSEAASLEESYDLGYEVFAGLIFDQRR